MQLMSERVFFMVLLTMFLERYAFTACVHMLYALNLSPFLHHQWMYHFGTRIHHLIVSTEKQRKILKNVHSHVAPPHFILLGTHWFILMPGQVLYWAKEEDKMEKLKVRLIELYYENLFKVSSLFCANSVS